MNNCEHCKNEFKPHYASRGRFCSSRCRGLFQTFQAVNSGKYSFRTARKYVVETRKYCCKRCGIEDWNDEPISLHLDHIDGNVQNNDLDNLRWLCPNCHSQTKTWGVKNATEQGRKRMSQNGHNGSQSKATKRAKTLLRGVA